MSFLKELELYNFYYRILHNNRNSKLHKRLRIAYNKDSLDNIEQVGEWLRDINEEMKELLQILKK